MMMIQNSRFLPFLFFRQRRRFLSPFSPSPADTSFDLTLVVDPEGSAGPAQQVAFRSGLSDQSFEPNENEWIFHFDGGDDVIFRLRAEATVGDAQSVISNARQIFFPPFALYVKGIALNNREKLLRFVSREITVRRSAFPSSEFHIVFPNGTLQSAPQK
jgi:hypothetical protein